MANTMMGPPDINFVNSLKANGNPGSGSDLSDSSDYVSILALRSALTAANGAYYTSARLDQLTVNDMVFALRNIQDPTTIADYMTASAA